MSEQWQKFMYKIYAKQIEWFNFVSCIVIAAFIMLNHHGLVHSYAVALALLLASFQYYFNTHSDCVRKTKLSGYTLISSALFWLVIPYVFFTGEQLNIAEIMYPILAFFCLVTGINLMNIDKAK